MAIAFTPGRCPKCQAPIKGTCDLVPGIALVELHEDGAYDFFGETKLYWDGQYPQEIDDDGNVLVVCMNDHEFFAKQEDI